MNNRRIMLIILLVALCLTLVINGFAEDETFTITTYYPSPYGVYKNLRIYPNDDFTPGNPCSSEGEMYYDNSEQTLYICSGGSWKPAPGKLGAIPSGMIAMFDTSCPTGWTRFSALDSKVPFGGAAYGATGGSATHTHTMSVGGPPFGPLAVFSSYCGGPPCDSGTGLAEFNPGKLYVLPPIASTVSNLPPYLTVIWCKKD